MTVRERQTTPPTVSAWLFGLTILVGAFLVFQVQPIISKSILPWFGGSPAVWTTCMLFFQVVLFAGYVYAHLLAKLRPTRQFVLHLGLIVVALLLLPVEPDPEWKSQAASSPTLTILLLLGSTVGLPYFVLSSTGPLVQHWYSRSQGGKTPYRLYALSNAGSLTALLTYPFLFEPALSTGSQSMVWSIAFVGFALCCGYCALKMRGHDRDDPAWRHAESPRHGAADPPRSAGADGKPSPRDCLVWLLLPALASMMLLATTNHVCQDVAVVPFLWVAPLSLYLVSFIVCFERETWYSRWWYGLATLICVTAVSTIVLFGNCPSLRLEVALYFAALFCVCMVCHGELVRRKPEPRDLTLFYLMSSAGGALGGALVALVCPHLFVGYLEMNLGLIVAYWIAALVAFSDPRVRGWLEAGRPKRIALFVLLGFVYVVRAQLGTVPGTDLVASRNFYGVLRLLEEEDEEGNRLGRSLVHGRTAHGFQFADRARRQLPTTYYARESGVGITLQHYPRRGPIRVGAIGLGAGTIAAYGRPGDLYRFYEINPEVERLAREYFTFLDDTPADVQVVLGDARLSMEREASQQFDVLVLDAFSGDAIPAHLLTREAFDVYRRHLRPEGVIAVHISNRHLDLFPVVAGLAEYLEMESLYFTVSSDGKTHRLASHWYVMSNNRRFMDNELVRGPARGELGTYASIPLWTDQYNNLFRLLK
jgi:hypothetical protein